ncbi:hypothetical protein J8I87_01030 [Paraburkholderia sp. LEh10]|uniref:hypothetical protein n=1 Tax=Paraburkholderia sp. LEh10 TaxID=2821353 RepID=UPI001AEB213E|nr:hypothetical protein [Paraburkholderia sp. LEh10]MBP0588326.1 hypothetical protein [Paraburkholderia sp. LEh10]
MGGLANVWVHNLTGGRWGEVIREPLLGLSRVVWILALLFLPVLVGMHDLYSWVPRASAGAQRWTDELPPHSAWFKNIWLTPWFFVVRSVLYLVVWTLLASLSRSPSLRRSARFSAGALIVYGLTVSLAAVDWVMSLMPIWFSSVFGMLAGLSQALAGMALAAVIATRMRPLPPPIIFRDLGNLLLMYVMTWAYLAFTQFLIIWAENLPHEIAWYIPRTEHGWLYVAWLLAVFHFFAPLLILLFRNAKEAPALLGALAAGLLAAHQLDVWWTIFPSLPVGGLQWLWSVPLMIIAFLIAGYVAIGKGSGTATAAAAGADYV